MTDQSSSDTDDDDDNSSVCIEENPIFPSLGGNVFAAQGDSDREYSSDSQIDLPTITSKNAFGNNFIYDKDHNDDDDGDGDGNDDGDDGDYEDDDESGIALREVFRIGQMKNISMGPSEVPVNQISELKTTSSEMLNPFEDDESTSLDSKVIEQMVAPSNEIITGDKFGFVRMYETLAKQKKPTNPNNPVLEKLQLDGAIPLQVMDSRNSRNSSVFELSKLADYDRFVKETHLNERIQAKVAKRVPKEKLDQETLSIIGDKDLADKFYAGHETTSKTKGRSFFSISKHSRSKKKSNSKVEHATDSDALDLYMSVSNSTNEQRGQKNVDGKGLNYLQRKLSVRHLQMISLGGTIGVGLFLNSGKAVNIAGGLGALLAFMIIGVVVMCTMVSFCEMVTFISVIDGVSGLSSRFVDDAFGFATGWLYFFSFAFGVAGEVVAGVIMLSYFPYLKTATNKGSTTGFVTLFLASIVTSNLIDVRVYGEIEYVSSFIKLLWALVMMIVMIILNRGGFGGPVLGFKYWDHLKSDFDKNIIFGVFRPSYNLYDTGTSPPSEGIGGNLGRFLSLLTAILVVCYAYSGTEIVCIAACEAKNPRKALPSATKRVFWRIVIFYCLSAFLVTLNIYAGDPRLLRYYLGSTGILQEEFETNIAIQAVGGMHCRVDSTVVAGYGSGAQSPWVVALQSAGLCNFSTAANIFLVFFAVSCGNAQLYVSSRTMYSLALQGKAPRFLAHCNRNGIPYNAVIFAASFGLLSYTCVSQSATVVFQNLNSVIASSGIFVWFAMCLTYIRFYYGLKRRPDIIGRDDKSYPYKSPFQPFSAIIGLVCTAIILLAMGFVVFLSRDWDTMFFFSSYGPLMVFLALYAGYRIIKGTSIPSLDRLDFDSGRTEMDRYIWDGGTEYNRRSMKEVFYKWMSFLA